MAIQTRVFNVSGMTCNHCAQSVKKVTTNLQGVENTQVNLEDNLVEVTYDDQAVAVDTIINTIEDAGFDASVASDK